ncbi:MAG TPA: TetR/AcrR family transcriptional regulator [Streptosporangiaceae bacterium]|jgi:AcrR family transcriptional regulator|nr:TetR/AcrR family transcriptional regulator [Streptosporangiaceae bacterium]
MSPVSDPAYPTDVRAALLAAAYAELVEHGPEGLSLRAIAARAGVSRGTPKWHFGNRAGLLTALAVQGYGQLDADVRAALTGLTDPAARFTALGRAYMAFGLDNPELFELMFQSGELDRGDPALGQAQREAFSVLIDAAAATTAEPASQALPTAGDIPLLAWACSHGLVALVRGGVLQAVTGLATRDQTAQLAYQLANTFTQIVTP